MSPVHPAPIQLADLAAVMRPDWDRAQFEGAVAGARAGGWSWPRVFIEACRLMTDEDATPRDLTAAADAAQRDPSRRVAPLAPGLTREWAAACREMLAARSAS